MSSDTLLALDDTTAEVASWEAAFAGLVREWAELEEDLLGQRRALHDDQVTRWEARLVGMRAEQNALMAAGMWTSGPADLLGVIGRSRRETVHSAILAWLMEPTAPHGLGTAFLDAVLRRCELDLDLDALDLRAATTQCEVSRLNCRADIVIWHPEFTVVFEVKVDAMERPRQCDDLFAAFQGEREPSFVFLTPRGRRPETATGEAAAEFGTLSFRDVRELLAQLVAAKGRASQGDAAVATYLQTLRKEFP